MLIPIFFSMFLIDTRENFLKIPDAITGEHQKEENLLRSELGKGNRNDIDQDNDSHFYNDVN